MTQQIFAPFARWWHSADEGSLAIVLQLALASALAWIVVAVFLDFDGFNTLRTNTKLSIYVKIGAAALAGVSTARSYFGLQEDIIARSPAWSQLRQRSADWALRGGALTVAATAAFWWLSSQVVGIAAQHVNGSPAIYHGSVIFVDRSTGPKAKCRIDMTVRIRPSLSKLQFCFAIWGGKPLGPLELGPLDAVVIHTRINALGEAVDSVGYDDGAGQN